MALIAEEHDRPVVRAPNADVFVGSPCMVILASGRYVLSYDEWADAPEAWPRRAKILTSDDAGTHWIERATLPSHWGTLVATPGGRLFHLGQDFARGALSVSEASADGATWGPSRPISVGDYSGSPTSYALQRGRLLIAFEERAPQNYATMRVFSAPIEADLADARSWQRSNAVAFPGIPEHLGWGRASPPYVAPIGWLEGNTVVIAGGVSVFARMRAGGTPGYAAHFTVTDDPRSGPTLAFAEFLPWPGGQHKFHMLFDPRSRLYWMASNIASDLSRDPVALRATGFKGEPENERRTLALWSSLDGMSWFPAGFVAVGAGMLDAYSYPFLVVDGDDLIVLSRTAKNAHNQHDTNQITFHRVRDFRRFALPDRLRH